jgi:patatin-related protein
VIKRELRLAVVIYGGASLAIYMHGVTKELLKLVRASKVFHEIGRARGQKARYQDSADHRESDTEEVYFELIRRINDHCHFRVVIDVIAGASAGAINGVMLGKAIVDDGLLEVQTPMWLNDADAEYLAEPRQPGQKWYLYPVLRLLSHWLPKEIGARPETREKLAHFVRSSWFQPPFSGKRLCTHFFNALDAMVASRRADSSLLPPGQRLDVYASLTDLAGYPNSLRLNEELVASDQAHAAYCQLSHGADADSSDFRDDNLPALVWAARASSSFAGAFPPFAHEELQQLLAERAQSWPGERQFLTHNLFVENAVPAAQLFDPAKRLFVDGGIVNNKPFGAAMAALNQRPADRHVDRYILYIEPDPKVEPPADPEQTISYLGTIQAGLFTIPRNQPILDELEEIVDQDKRVQINRRLIEAHQDAVQALVARLSSQHSRQALSADLLAYLRGRVAEEAAQDMGAAYLAYVRRRVWRLTEALMEEWSLLSDQPHLAETRADMLRSIETWWVVEDETRRRNSEQDFLDRFDVTFRIRRLQFVIRRLNQHAEAATLDSRSRDASDVFKQVIYQYLNQLYELRGARQIDDALIELLYRSARSIPLSRSDARGLLRALADSLDLARFDRGVDDAFAEFLQELGDDELRQAFLSDYVGFPVYDVLLYTPGSRELGPDPLTRIHVDRISPRDADSLTSAFGGLKSRNLMGFLGFFNREYREHDYLWGRLNSAERMVDLLVKVMPSAFEDGEATHFKLQLFQAILKKEKRRLYRCDKEFKELDALIASLGDRA